MLAVSKIQVYRYLYLITSVYFCISFYFETCSSIFPAYAASFKSVSTSEATNDSIKCFLSCLELYKLYWVWIDFMLLMMDGHAITLLNVHAFIFYPFFNSAVLPDKFK